MEKKRNVKTPSNISIILAMIFCAYAKVNADPEISGRDPIDTFFSPNVRQSVSRNKILRGGPKIDGIPALVEPYLVSSISASFLRDNDMVLGIELRGNTRAYPIKILNRHEIVNDVIHGVPVAITYCPLCRTGIAFERKLKDRTFTLGVSGLLYNSAMVMYDWETRSLWTQVLGEAIVGEMVGTSLRQIPLYYSAWKDWKDAHPMTLVLSNQTGYFRNYDQDPYAGYELSENLYFPVEVDDSRLKRKQLVYGIRLGDIQKVYPLEVIRKQKRSLDKIGEKVVIVEWKNGAVQSSQEDGTAIPGTVAYWFAWVTFFPKTELYSIK